MWVGIWLACGALHDRNRACDSSTQALHGKHCFPRLRSSSPYPTAEINWKEKFESITLVSGFLRVSDGSLYTKEREVVSKLKEMGK